MTPPISSPDSSLTRTNLFCKLKPIDLTRTSRAPTQITGDVPTPRRGHASCFLGGWCYVHGGFDGVRHLADTYRIRPGEWRWERLSPAGPAPPPRRQHAACPADGALLVHGGYDGDRFLGDAWAFDPASCSWAPVRAAAVGDVPGLRAAHLVARAGDRVVLVGGVGHGGAAAGVHALSPAGWAARGAEAWAWEETRQRAHLAEDAAREARAKAARERERADAARALVVEVEEETERVRGAVARERERARAAERRERDVAARAEAAEAGAAEARASLEATRARLKEAFEGYAELAAAVERVAARGRAAERAAKKEREARRAAEGLAEEARRALAVARERNAEAAARLACAERDLSAAREGVEAMKGTVEAVREQSERQRREAVEAERSRWEGELHRVAEEVLSPVPPRVFDRASGLRFPAQPSACTACPIAAHRHPPYLHLADGPPAPAVRRPREHAIRGSRSQGSRGERPLPRLGRRRRGPRGARCSQRARFRASRGACPGDGAGGGCRVAARRSGAERAHEGGAGAGAGPRDRGDRVVQAPGRSSGGASLPGASKGNVCRYRPRDGSRGGEGGEGLGGGCGLGGNGGERGWVRGGWERGRRG